MSLRHVAGMAEYLRLLRGNADEVKALAKDLLISVTSFFRDRPAWQFLEDEIIPRIVDAKSSGQPLRIWVPGCATGEEAYSVAILLIERLQAAQKSCSLQIFASDTDGDALDVARAGVYPESIAADVTSGRLRRFFVKEEHTYRVDKELRETVIFAQQNLLSDPPFSRLDLVSCRNFLMYLEPAVQEKIVTLLHFALLEGGYLFLGSAETIGEQEDLFEPVSKKWRIYRRIGPTRQDKVEFPVASEPKPGAPPSRALAMRPALHRVATLAQQLLLERYAPACVVISRKGRSSTSWGRRRTTSRSRPARPRWISSRKRAKACRSSSGPRCSGRSGRTRPSTCRMVPFVAAGRATSSISRSSPSSSRARPRGCSSCPSRTHRAPRVSRRPRPARRPLRRSRSWISSIPS
jgi:two-component system CheB/CheR fusion protein